MKPIYVTVLFFFFFNILKGYVSLILNYRDEVYLSLNISYGCFCSLNNFLVNLILMNSSYRWFATKSLEIHGGHVDLDDKTKGSVIQHGCHTIVFWISRDWLQTTYSQTSSERILLGPVSRQPFITIGEILAYAMMGL